ncbi:hypothetical protein EV361DRAFT_864996 [Lentinula raphanica]|nr:hypothetical protein EV361DRAFT_864996 [Lentinula raphanica]
MEEKAKRDSSTANEFRTRYRETRETGEEREKREEEREKAGQSEEEREEGERKEQGQEKRKKKKNGWPLEGEPYRRPTEAPRRTFNHPSPPPHQEKARILASGRRSNDARTPLECWNASGRRLKASGPLESLTNAGTPLERSNALTSFGDLVRVFASPFGDLGARFLLVGNRTLWHTGFPTAFRVSLDDDGDSFSVGGDSFNEDGDSFNDDGDSFDSDSTVIYSASEGGFEGGSWALLGR